jgi:hypothetical protein
MKSDNADRIMTWCEILIGLAVLGALLAHPSRWLGLALFGVLLIRPIRLILWEILRPTKKPDEPYLQALEAKSCKRCLENHFQWAVHLMGIFHPPTRKQLLCACPCHFQEQKSNKSEVPAPEG